MLLTVLLLCIGTTVVHGEIREACPDGSFFFKEECYYFYRGEVTQVNAEDYCSLRSSSLVRIYDEETNNFIKSTVKGMDTTGAVGVWFDSYYSSTNGWGYDDDEYTDWADDPAPGGKGTCQFMSASKEWKWDAQDCDSKQDMFYVCNDSPLVKDCYESACFLLSGSSEQCEIGEGYLAKIKSEDENNFVKQFLREAKTDDNVYIDGSDAGTEGTWVFADGEAMPIDDFDSDEPNNAGTGEDCIAMAGSRDFKWIDYTCGDPRLSFLCEEPMSGIVG